MYWDKGDIAFFTIMGTIALGTVGAVGGLIAHGINVGVVSASVGNNITKIEEKRKELSNIVANKANIDNFDIASVELARGAEDKYLFKAFGSTSYEQIVGLKENKYLNVFFEISQYDANKIMDSVRKLDETERRRDLTSTEHSAILDETQVNEWKFTENGRIGKTTDACVELYNAMNEAVQRAYSSKFEEIFEASNINNATSKVYRYMRPEFVGDTHVSGFFAHGNTVFVNAGVMTTNISQVIKDEEKGISYFLVDTLQGRENNGDIVVDTCRARVEIEGTDLSQEEVYAKFVKGEYSSFVELAREKVGSKVSVVNNALASDVEEIELL